MKVRVHLPDTEEGWEMLNNRLAEFQSEFIINEINKLPHSYEEKLQILDGVIERIKEVYG